jgi:hypothetical protein
MGERCQETTTSEAQSRRSVAQVRIWTDHASSETIRQEDGGAAFPPVTHSAERSWKAGRITLTADRLRFGVPIRLRKSGAEA